MTGAWEPVELLAAEPAPLTGVRIGDARVSAGGQRLERQIVRSLDRLSPSPLKTLGITLSCTPVR